MNEANILSLTVGMLGQVFQCKQKKRRWPTRGPPLAHSINRTAKCSLTLKKLKIVFKIRKVYLRIMAIKDLCFKEVHKLKNSN